MFGVNHFAPRRVHYYCGSSWPQLPFFYRQELGLRRLCTPASPRGWSLQALQSSFTDAILLASVDQCPTPGKSWSDSTWLEIGFGRGDHLAAQLRMHPNVHFLAAEPRLDSIAHLLKSLGHNERCRLAVFPGPAHCLLALLAESSLDRIFILFPDAYPQRQHRSRRLLQKEFLTLLLSRLKSGGHMRVASDSVDYVAELQDLWAATPELRQTFGPCVGDDPALWPARPTCWPATLWERRAISQGLPCAYFELTKNGVETNTS